MARVLILFAHPALEKSRVHRRLIRELPEARDLTFHDLYEQYPTFDVDVSREQTLLAAHDLIVLQHPFFWYSTPALLKQWEDLVLEHGWAYGSKGTVLRGKRMLSVVSTGGQATAYRRDGLAGHSVREFLVPIEQTARLCGMEYLPPYLIQGSHGMTPPDIELEARSYGRLIALLLSDALALGETRGVETLNELLASRLREETTV